MKTKKKTSRTHNFDSVSQFVAESVPKARASGLTDYRDDSRSQRSWYGTPNFEAAERLLSTGWREGAERIAALRDRVSGIVEAVKRAKTQQVSYDVTGEWVDVGRIATGEPECCGVQIDDGSSATERVVTLRYNAAVSCSVSTDAITARGVAVLAAVDLIESCGVRCEVYYSQGSRAFGGAEDHLECNVLVKEAGQAVDLDRLAFVLTHPSFFRRFGFAFLEGNGHRPGCSAPAALSDVGQRDGTIEINQVCTPTGLDDEELAEHILSIAAACGIDLDDETRDAIISGRAI
jgi:hypothetical protein